MAKSSTYLSPYLVALFESIDEMKRKSKRARGLLTTYALGYFCVAEDDGVPLLLVPVNRMIEQDERTFRTRALQHVHLLSQSKHSNLSREIGGTGAIRALPFLFSLAGSTPELCEVLMFMVAVKTGVMAKEIARDRLYHFPNKFMHGGTDDVWEV
jgi:hypothetical protein